METINLELTGLTCEACAKLAQKRIAKIEGVVEVSVDEDGKTVITGEHVISKEEVSASLADTDYKVK